MSHPNREPATVLASLRRQLHREGHLTPSNARALLELCRHPVESIREAALLLLLHPPVEDEPAHYVDLLNRLGRDSPVRRRELPLALYELALAWIATLRGFPARVDLCASLEHLLNRCPRRVLRYLAERRFLFKEVGFKQMPRILTALCGQRARAFGRKIRLFTRRKWEAHAPWASPTTADIHPLGRNPRTGRPQRLTQARWMRVCRALSTPARQGLPPTSRFTPRSVQQVYWGGHGPITLSYLDHLFQLQRQEIASQKTLCNRISAATGRVVLSLHNASLAAVGGWGFEPQREVFKGGARRREFINSVQRESERIQEHDPEALRQLEAIWELWHERLVRPRLEHTLREARMGLRLDPERYSGSMGDDTALHTLLRATRASESEDERQTLMEAVAPHQRADPAEILAWRAERLASWKPGWLRLAALLIRGGSLMSRREIPALTVPWIDKFFISSRRDRDIAYLPALVHWLRERGAHPIVLLWDDTAHAREPSLKLALDRMMASGARFRGIGVFDKTVSSRADAERIVLSEHAERDLFALRPFDDTHVGHSLHQLLARLEPSLYATYDSSWKDNLSFLYCGTQVSSLLSAQAEMEALPPWVAVDGGKLPFGVFFRSALRRSLLGETDEKPDGFWSAYSAWANLG